MPRRRKSKGKIMFGEGAAVMMNITETQSVGGGRRSPEATETGASTGWASRILVCHAKELGF